MSIPIYLPSSFTIIDTHDKNAKEELPNSMETLYFNNSFDSTTMDSQTLDLFENFSLSNYEDDDSGIYCPCCLLR
jgi:hypothetical protein